MLNIILIMLFLVLLSTISYKVGYVRALLRVSSDLNNDYRLRGLSQVYNNRQVAEGVLSKLQDYLNDYGVVSISDYKDILGEIPTFQDTKYGWTNLREARVYRARGGYTVSLPKMITLN